MYDELVGDVFQKNLKKERRVEKREDLVDDIVNQIRDKKLRKKLFKSLEKERTMKNRLLFDFVHSTAGLMINNPQNYEYINE